MDLIGALTQQLGVNSDKAEGLAGGVLEMIKGQVAEKVGPAPAQQLAANIPELGQWAGKAQALTGGDGGGLMGALGGLMGGGGGAGFDLGALSKLVAGAGLDVSSAQTLLPVVLDFLKARLDSDLLQKVLAAVPGLQGLAGGDTEALLGSLGGLFGKP